MQTDIEPEALTSRFRSLISRHAKLVKKEAGGLIRVLDGLLPAFRDKRKKWAETQRQSANDFNLLAVMGVHWDEICHSKILAWLLDHRIESGTHAQGDLGFRLLLEELRPELGKERAGQLMAYAREQDYWVRREVSGDEAKVDIEIAACGRFLVHLENKIHSVEGKDQTDREWRDLQARRNELGVPEEACYAIFLTLDASKAMNINFRSIGWNRIAKVAEKFADRSKPPEVKLFARHYAKAIRELSVVERDELGADNAEV